MVAKNYDLFVSYADADREWVEGYLLDALQQAGVNYCSEETFTLGAVRLEEFEKAIRDSERTLLILSNAYLADTENRFVNSLAQHFGFDTSTWPVIPLYLESELKVPTQLRVLVGLDATAQEKWEKVIERLCKDIDTATPKEAKIPDCPYPGMVPFSEDDSQRFFGRSQEIKELLNRLHSSPFLTVIGPSGSGKSSLVFAGLIPALRESKLFGSGEWLVRVIRPGATPLTTLKTSLNSDLSDPTQAVTDLLTTQHEDEKLLLVVDQFEELFTTANQEASEVKQQEVIPFQETLLRLSQVSNCYVVLTVRADFYPDLMSSPLWHKIQSHRFEVVPLNQNGLRDAIVKPAEDVGVFMEPALVDRLITDSAGEPGILPLLQETLVLLWQRIERRFLPLRAYDSLILILPRNVYGHKPTGLQVAIALRADAAVGDLSNEQEATIARRIFLRLVQFGEGRKDTRRQQTVSALRVANEDSHLFEQVLEHLVKRRLLTKSGEESEEQKVDIAHEALIMGWPSLQQWIAERGEAEQNRRRLTEKAKEWVRLGKGKSGLLDEGELKEANAWLKSSDALYLGLDETLIDLVTDSEEQIKKIEQDKEDAQKRELELIRERIEQEKKARQAAQTKTKFAISAAVLAVVALIAVGFGWQQQQRTVRLISNLVVRPNEVELEVIDDLPIFLNKGDRSRKVAEKSKNSQDYEQAIGYYRAIVFIANRLQRKNELNPGYLSAEDKNKIYNFSDEATQNLLDIIQDYGLYNIENQLQQRNFGKRMRGKNPESRDRNFQDLENQFDGALKETYKVIMIDTAADMNQNGLLFPEKEYKRVPCDLLREIEELWRKYTTEKCGGLGSDPYSGRELECKGEEFEGINTRPLSALLFAPMDYKRSIRPLIKSCSAQMQSKL
ncbi:MAG: TIR domain-containing protein [Crocosphaera sp.]